MAKVLEFTGIEFYHSIFHFFLFGVKKNYQLLTLYSFVSFSLCLSLSNLSINDQLFSPKEHRHYHEKSLIFILRKKNQANKRQTTYLKILTELLSTERPVRIVLARTVPDQRTEIMMSIGTVFLETVDFFVF